MPATTSPADLCDRYRAALKAVGFSERETGVERFRKIYRAVLTVAGLSPAELKERCEGYMAVHYIDETPAGWARAAQAILEQIEFDEIVARGEPGEPDDEGYMGTGMSEEQYYRAAGSAEFDY